MFLCKQTVYSGSWQIPAPSSFNFSAAGIESSFAASASTSAAFTNGRIINVSPSVSIAIMWEDIVAVFDDLPEGRLKSLGVIIGVC